MDLEALTPAVQQLVIAATVDWLMEGHLTVPVIVVLPEARDFIPKDRRTPAKLALENLIRKGARVSRYLWLDSQALTGLRHGRLPVDRDMVFREPVARPRDTPCGEDGARPEGQG